jgi:hypothetical protein
MIVAFRFKNMFLGGYVFKNIQAGYALLHKKIRSVAVFFFHERSQKIAGIHFVTAGTLHMP